MLNPGVKNLWNEVTKFRHLDSRYIFPFKQYLDASNKPYRIIKDPFALLSTEWLYDTFDLKVVLIVRHPAAYALSMQKRNWVMSYLGFEDQQSTLSLLFPEAQLDIDQYVSTRKKMEDIIGASILSWTLLHKIIKALKQKHADWIIVRHEDLSKDPNTYFGNLLEELDLKANQKFYDHILTSTQGKTMDGRSRNALKNSNKWRFELSNQDIKRIKEGTAEIYPYFYDESDW